LIRNSIWTFIPEKKKEEKDVESLRYVGFIFGLTWLVTKLTPTIANWKEYTMFNKVIAGIYFYTTHLPIKFILSPWNYIFKLGLTQYKNLNLVLACLNSALFFFLILSLLGLLAEIIVKVLPGDFKNHYILSVIYFGPIAIWIVIFLLKIILEWLFA
jgi:hypothetical protein